MIVRRIHVRRFRKLRDQIIVCGPGLNVIRGHNDAGKSTLHLAFSAALYPSKPREIQSYGPWGDDRPGEITIDFEADGRTYRLHKDFRTRRVSLRSEDQEFGDPRDVEHRVAAIVGLPSVTLFRATLHITQWDLAVREREQQQEIGARLSRIVTGGDSDAARILRALDERLQQLEVGLRRPSKTPGPLKRDADRIARLSDDERRLGAEVAAIEEAASERDRLAARIADLETQLRSGESLIAANIRLRELDIQWQDLVRRAGDLQSLTRQIESASRDAEVAERDEGMTITPLEAAAIEELRGAELRVAVLDDEAKTAHLSASRRPTAHEAEGRPEESRYLALARRRWPTVVEAMAGLAIVLALARVAVLASSHQGTAGEFGWLAVLAILAALVGSLARMGAMAARHVRRMMVEAKAETLAGELARAQDEIGARRREAARALESALRAVNAPSVASLLERQHRAVDARQTLASARRVLVGLLGGRSIEAIADEYRGVLIELGTVQSQRGDPALQLKRLDPAAFQDLQHHVERQSAERETAKATLQRLEGRLGVRSPYEELARAREEAEETRTRLARTQRQVEVLRLARDVLTEAHRHTIVPGKARLEQLASDYLYRLSGGAYGRIVVDEDTLDPRVWVGPPKEWAAVADREIGSGAVDQCYLALRLGLIDLLCEGRCPPLFLDDPFLAYDEDRQSAAMALLRDLACDRQIFLFTCRGVYDASAAHVIVLGDVPASAPRA
jgi:DNA repair exonuclease SbcCD ATPase subunit